MENKIKFHAPWCPGLPQDEESLSILKNSGIVTGVQTSAVDEELSMIMDAGLEYSLHMPGREMTMNPAADDFPEAFRTNRQLIKALDAAYNNEVGIHIGYSNTKIKKPADCKRKKDITAEGDNIDGSDETARRIIGNIRDAYYALIGVDGLQGCNFLLENLFFFNNNEVII